MELDVEGLRARVLRPARPRLAEAREALRDVVAPREALELAAAKELCPMSWLDDPLRAFGGQPHSPRRVPHGVDAVIAMVSDSDGIVAAETLAREAHHRVAQWSRYTVPQQLVYWKVAKRSLHDGGTRSTNQGPLPNGVPTFSVYVVDNRYWRDAMAKVGLESFPSEPRRGALARFARRLIGADSYEDQLRTYWLAQWATALADRRWSVAMRQAVEDHQFAWAYALFANAGYCVSDVLPESLRVAIDRGLQDRKLSTLPNVFEPLAQLWWTGYALHIMNFGQIELHLPALDAER